MRDIWRHQAWIVLVTGLAVLTNLGSTRLWDEDEPKNATCAAEMLARGDWIVPTFNGELRTDKPILLYWLMVPLYHLLGVTELAARLTSAVCGLGTALLTYHIGRRLFRPEVGLWAGLLLGTSLMFDVASRAATPDGLLIFFSTLAIYFFVAGGKEDGVARVGTEPLARRNPGLPGAPGIRAAGVGRTVGETIHGLPIGWHTYVGMYGAMALAVLAKGPVGMVLPTAVIGLYLLVLNPAPQVWRRNSTATGGNLKRRWLEAAATAAVCLANTLRIPRVLRFALSMRPLTALGMLALVALPWYIIVGLQTDWAWPAGFFWQHNVGRYMAPMEGHGGPPFYHLLSLAVGFFPGSIFLAPTAIHVWRQLRNPEADHHGYLLALCWIAVYLIVFSLAGTKLPSYVTPTYPALALLTGAFFAKWIAEPLSVSRPWLAAALSVYGVVGLGIVVALVVVAQKFFPQETTLAALGLIPMAGAAACLALWRRNRNRGAAIAFVASAAAFSTALFGWALPRVDRYQEAAQISSIVRAHSQGEPRVATYHVLRPSWVYYARQRLVTHTKPAQAIEAITAKPDGFVLVEASRLPELTRHLPPGVHELGRVPRFFKRGEIVVLGSSRQEAPLALTAQRSDYSRLK